MSMIRLSSELLVRDPQFIAQELEHNVYGHTFSGALYRCWVRRIHKCFFREAPEYILKKTRSLT